MQVSTARDLCYAFAWSVHVCKANEYCQLVHFMATQRRSVFICSLPFLCTMACPLVFTRLAYGILLHGHHNLM